METTLLVIHLMIVLALIVVVLLQRSEGGALGIGGGGGFLSSRGQANALTRATSILAVGFFVTSLALAVLARVGGPAPSLFGPADGSGNLLEQLGGSPGQQTPAEPAQPATPQAPVSQ